MTPKAAVARSWHRRGACLGVGAALVVQQAGELGLHAGHARVAGLVLVRGARQDDRGADLADGQHLRAPGAHSSRVSDPSASFRRVLRAAKASSRTCKGF